MFIRSAAAVICGFLISCAAVPRPVPTTDSEILEAAHRDDPTPEHPKVGCIADSPLPALQIRAKTEMNGRILPEIVRVIGVYESAIGEQWKVLRAGEFNLDNWQPWLKRKIQFFGCGPEAEAYGAANRAPSRQ